MNWKIYEHRNIEKTIRKLPLQIVKKYELWKELINRHGPGILADFPGFNDEALKGERVGQRSSRLNIKYRVIYQVVGNEIAVYVIEITPHKY